MTRRAWLLVAGAYALLAIGAVITVYLLQQEANDIETINRRLVYAAAAYCQAGIAPDTQEKQIIDQLSRGDYNADQLLELDPICQRIIVRLKDGQQ